MNEDLLKKLRTVRNELAHSQRRPDPESLAKRLQALDVLVPAGDLQWFAADLLRGASDLGEYFVPPVLLSTVNSLLDGRSARRAWDPWAGFGVLAATVHAAVNSRHTFASARSQEVVALARVLAPQLDWQTGDPLAFLDTQSEPFDVITSVLPFGVRAREPAELHGEAGQASRRQGDLGQVLLTAGCLRLSPDGIGMFVVPPNFFFAKHSILADMPRLGLGIEAALALPSSSFAPYTNIQTYLIVVKKQILSKMFVAQLSDDIHANRQVVANLREGKVDGALEFGRFLPPEEFRGLEPLRLAERIDEAEQRFQGPAVRLGDLARTLQLGRPGNEFEFATAENALYIPLIGISDVVDSVAAMTLKPQNYAQISVDSGRSDARFVARFLNSELGRSIRAANKSGTTIPKLNTSGLNEIRIFIPDLKTQREVLDLEARIGAEHNTLLGLQNDLTALRRDLWANPGQLAVVSSQLQVLSGQLGRGATPFAASTLEQWFETLPFPLASILRAWQATSSEDYKTKYEHLLHFFEAVAEFVGVIFLSAYSSRPEFFIEHRKKLMDAWVKQRLSLERATFGTWRVVVEYFAKQTRGLLDAGAEERVLCGELFADPSLAFPEMLARKELTAVISAGNKRRNDWTGHGGVVSPEEARLRNEQMLFEVQRLRDAMARGWADVQLVRSVHCKPRRSLFENEVALLVGSNSEFLRESRSMTAWLDVERLYVVSQKSGGALLLLPLMRVGPSPTSAQNAFYFFSRVDKDGARFVSYHFMDQPEFRDQSNETSAAIRFLTENVAGADE